jgi:predicted RNA-binding Zn ribbon-like protein
MNPTPGSLDDARLPVEFANTLRCSACRSDDALAGPSLYEAWARQTNRRLPRHLSASDLGHLRLLRSTIVALLRATVLREAPSRRVLRAFHSAVGPTQPRPRIEWTRGHWISPERVRRGRALERTTEVLHESTVSLLLGSRAGRLRACQGKGCAHFLLARTRNQRWCSSTGCGNRARVARHHARSKRTRGRSPPAPRAPRLRAPSPLV